MHPPLISIIVAVYNRVATLQRCLDSVLTQDYPAKELIVIDGGSTDGTVEVLQRNSNHLAYWHSEPDRGIYHAFNQALALAQGEWILFLGADDYLWQPQVLSNFTQALTRVAPESQVVYGQVGLVSPWGELLDYLNRPWEEIQSQFLGSCNCTMIIQQGTFYRRSLFLCHGGYDESFAIAGDYEFLLRELKTHRPHFLSDLIVAGMQIGGISGLPASRLRVVQEYHRAQRKHDLAPQVSWSYGWAYGKALGLSLGNQLLGQRLTGYLVDFYRQWTGRKPIWARSSKAAKTHPQA